MAMVAAHNETAAAAAVAEGLTSGDAALEQAALHALRFLGQQRGCASLNALLRRERAGGRPMRHGHCTAWHLSWRCCSTACHISTRLPAAGPSFCRRAARGSGSGLPQLGVPARAPRPEQSRCVRSSSRSDGGAHVPALVRWQQRC